MPEAIVFDTETTGFSADAQIIEAAWLEVALALDSQPISIGDGFEQRYKPTVPIDYAAMATHHILPDDLKDCPAPDSFALPALSYLIGHNVDYDWKMVGSPEHIKRICTVAMARKLWPDTSHKLGAMMYFLTDTGLMEELRDGGHVTMFDIREQLKDAHSALADCHMCAALLGCIINELHFRRGFEIASWDDVYAFSEQSRIPDKIDFGKHSGMLITELPYDYKVWLLTKATDLDPYLRAAVQRTM